MRLQPPVPPLFARSNHAPGTVPFHVSVTCIGVALPLPPTLCTLSPTILDPPSIPDSSSHGPRGRTRGELRGLLDQTKVWTGPRVVVSLNTPYGVLIMVG